MLVTEFVEEFKTLEKAESKADFCNQHLKRVYAPIIEKVAVLKTLVDSCVMKNESGILYVDMICNKMNFTHAIITLYTDLQLADPRSEEVKTEVLNNYDSFQEYGIIDVFCDLIGEREINELLLINKEALNTWHEEHSSTRAFVSDLTEKAVRTFVETMAVMKETIPDEEKEELTKSVKDFIEV